MGDDKVLSERSSPHGESPLGLYLITKHAVLFSHEGHPILLATVPLFVPSLLSGTVATPVCGTICAECESRRMQSCAHFVANVASSVAGSRERQGLSAHAAILLWTAMTRLRSKDV